MPVQPCYAFAPGLIGRDPSGHRWGPDSVVCQLASGSGAGPCQLQQDVRRADQSPPATDVFQSAAQKAAEAPGRAPRCNGRRWPTDPDRCAPDRGGSEPGVRPARSPRPTVGTASAGPDPTGGKAYRSWSILRPAGYQPPAPLAKDARAIAACRGGRAGRQ